MNKKVSNRLIYISISVLLLIISALITARVFNESIVFFRSPTEVLALHPTDYFRLGGLIKENSVKTEKDVHEFIITDLENEIKVQFTGILPTLFKEGQGAIAYGTLKGDIFIAQEILAKHDENYMPKEVAQTLKSKNLWKTG